LDFLIKFGLGGRGNRGRLGLEDEEVAGIVEFIDDAGDDDGPTSDDRVVPA